MMAAAMPTIPNMASNTIVEAINKKGSSFFLHVNDLIFSENIGISDTRSNDVITANTDRPTSMTTEGIDANPSAICGKRQ